jgi:hypothetical protein
MIQSLYIFILRILRKQHPGIDTKKEIIHFNLKTLCMKEVKLETRILVTFGQAFYGEM